jgi:hypothetical protein
MKQLAPISSMKWLAQRLGSGITEHLTTGLGPYSNERTPGTTRSRARHARVAIFVWAGVLISVIGGVSDGRGSSPTPTPKGLEL